MSQHETRPASGDAPTQPTFSNVMALLLIVSASFNVLIAMSYVLSLRDEVRQLEKTARAPAGSEACGKVSDVQLKIVEDAVLANLTRRAATDLRVAIAHHQLELLCASQ